ncbi:MAG: hypothetical protein HYY45_03380 [Deltaproteobacteria bacterium]|nr:hypothetical protein [Deltaproteobacteria bacterium]
MPNQTPFYPKRKLAVGNAYTRIDRELITPWVFFNSGKPLKVTNCEGRALRYSNVEFEGSPREIFWGGFFEPDFRKVITEQIDQTAKDCEAYPELVDTVLDETADLLREFVQKAYEHLAEIDQRLRGKGYPNSVQRRPVDDKIEAMTSLLDDHIEAAKKLAALARWADISLEEEQKNLLVMLAEAARNVPQDQREPARFTEDRSQGYLFHPGFRGREPQAYLGDLKVLAGERLIDLKQTSSSAVWLIDIVPKGFSYYGYLKRQMGKPTQRIEAEMKHHIGSHRFRSAYAEAYRKWSAAEDLLWSEESERHLTTIGHHCREALQEFADVLVQRYCPPNVDSDKAHTKNRLRSVLEFHAGKLSNTEGDFLRTLLDYWESVNNLVQRQIHGMQKGKESLIWEDARRVVFQTLVLMFEVDRALSRVVS